MAFDYKKEFKELYLPPEKAALVRVPKMSFVAVRGKGNPNEEDGEYKRALAVLYAISYTIKMSKKGGRRIAGYFDFVVPPLEGFWWQEKNGEVVAGFDYADKSSLSWISVIRLPDFVSQADFDWARDEAARKKGLDCSRAEMLELEEGDLTLDRELDDIDEYDSMAKLSLIVLMEDEFGVKLTGDVIRGFETVGDIVALMQ